MSYTFNSTIRSQLDTLLNAGDYPAAYTLLSDILGSGLNHSQKA